MDEYSDTVKALADRPYSVVCKTDTLSDGTPIYLAQVPELPGCMTHGDTPDERDKMLIDAKRLYIQSLLDDGLPVPEPRIWNVQVDGTLFVEVKNLNMGSELEIVGTITQ